MYPGVFQQQTTAGGAFSPTDISGLVLWLDASDTDTITESGGAVSQWDDKSGNNNDVTESTNKPTTGSRTVGPLNAIDFDGSNDELSRADACGITGNPDLTAVIVFDIDANSNAHNMLQVGEGSGAGDYRRMTGYAADNSFRYDTGAQVFDDVGTGAQALIFEKASGDTFEDGRLWKDGSEASQIGIGNPTETCNITDVATYVGKGRYRNPDLEYFTNGAACEIMLYNAVLSTSEKNQLLDYIEDKWGITCATIT